MLQRPAAFNPGRGESQYAVHLVDQPCLDHPVAQRARPAIQGLAPVDPDEAFQQVDLLLVGYRHVDGIAFVVHDCTLCIATGRKF